MLNLKAYRLPKAKSSKKKILRYEALRRKDKAS